MTAVTVRPAIRDDVIDLHRLLVAFGRHGGYNDWMTVTPAMLEQALFAEPITRFAHVATVDGATVGMALWFLTFNFGRCQSGLYLEDLYVDAAARGMGVGEALMQALAGEAVRRVSVDGLGRAHPQSRRQTLLRAARRNAQSDLRSLADRGRSDARAGGAGLSPAPPAH